MFTPPQPLQSTEHKAMQLINKAAATAAINNDNYTKNSEQNQVLLTGQQKEVANVTLNRRYTTNNAIELTPSLSSSVECGIDNNGNINSTTSNSNNNNNDDDDNDEVNVEQITTTTTTTAKSTKEEEGEEQIANYNNNNNNNNIYDNNSNNSYTGKPRSNQFSWKCGACGYHVLAMDQNGKPLPLLRSAFQHVIPLTCPRCKLTHTNWTSTSPFNSHGDHVNIRSRLANRMVNLITNNSTAATNNNNNNNNNSNNNNISNSTAESKREFEEYSHLSQIDKLKYYSMYSNNKNNNNNDTSYTSSYRPTISENYQSYALVNNNNSSNNVKRKEANYSFYCDYCQRRLLRVDMNGNVIAMDVDSEGQPLPITCPGCKRTHNE